MNNDDINLEEMRVEAEKMLPGIGEYIQEGGEVIRISPGETLDLFGARSVAEIDRILDSENKYLRALIDKPRVDFPFRRYETTLSTFSPIAKNHNSELIEAIEEIRDQYEKEEKHPMSLSIFLSRGESGESYFDRVIQKVRDDNSHALKPVRSSYVPFDPINRSGGLLHIPPEEYGKRQFYPTGENGDKTIGISGMLSRDKKALNEIESETLPGLDGIDRRIIGTIDDELEAGNKFIPLNRIYKGIGGRSEIGTAVQDNLSLRILSYNGYIGRLDNSLESLAGYDYPVLRSYGSLVPCKVHIVANEDDDDAVRFNGKVSPAYVEVLVDHLDIREASRGRKQGKHIPKNVRQTPNNITARNCDIEDYLIERISNEKLKNIISWSSVYTAGKIKKEDRKAQHRARKVVETALQYWKEIGWIKDYLIQPGKSSFSFTPAPDQESLPG